MIPILDCELRGIIHPGFLGRRVVQRLLERDFSVRVASRHPEGTAAIFPDLRLRIEPILADINDDCSVATGAILSIDGGYTAW
jgi:nucleoside-diphosphate-sugar epimerase